MTLKKDALQTFGLVLLYALCFYLLQLFLHKNGFVATLPSANSIAHWDVLWYNDWVKEGYKYNPDHPNNLAFFFLFPLIWKLTHLSYIGISILNIVFFGIGFGIISSLLKVSLTDKLIWLSIPSIYFAFIPYSEALFFLLAASALWGIEQKKPPLIWVCLFLMCLTRATGAFLAPALLAMNLISFPRKNWLKTLWHYVWQYLSPMIAGTFLFIWYQFKVTGIWFVFFEVEEKHWGHKFAWPTLPFSTIGGPPTLWISAIAIFICFTALLFLIAYGIKWLLDDERYDKLVVVSMGYMVMAMLETVFYNPTWTTFTTTVSGIHRYVMCNPFFYILLHHFTHKLQYKWSDYLLIFLVANMVWLLFGSYAHIAYFIYFQGNTALILLYMAYANKKYSWPAMVLFGINLFFQIHMFQMFLTFSSYPE